MNHEIVFYDDACPFCCASAAFLAAIDRRDRFRFAPLGGKWARFSIPDVKDRGVMVMLERKRGTWLGGKAVFRTFWLIGGRWRLLGWAYLLPKAIIDPLYRFIARYRYHFPGSDASLSEKKQLD